MVKIVPSITSVLTSLGGKIPVSTSIIIALSEALKKNFLNILLCILLSMLLLGYYMRKPTKKDFFYKILFRLPFIGHLYKKVLEVKILRSLSILIKSGVNIVNALEITSEICNNNIIQKEFYTSINWVKSGRNFSDAMKNMNLFNTLTISMMKIGEETGNLDNMLFKTTSILDEEVATYTSRLTELIQPIMIIIISLIIGGIVAAVIMPMFSIYGTI
jgi:Type II secretory pathway, component PulF